MIRMHAVSGFHNGGVRLWSQSSPALYSQQQDAVADGRLRHQCRHLANL